MPLIKNAVGRNLYVWSKHAGRPGSNACIISAHGSKPLFGQRYRGPDVELVYYVRDGQVLADRGLLHFISRSNRPYEALRSKQSLDYALSKYANSSPTGRLHNVAGETYGSIERLPEDLAKEAQNLQLAMNLARQAGLEQHAQWFERSLSSYPDEWPYDIVTVRDRWHRTVLNSVTLSEAVSALHGAGYNYSVIHCSFCRSSLIGNAVSTRYAGQAINFPVVQSRTTSSGPRLINGRAPE